MNLQLSTCKAIHNAACGLCGAPTLIASWYTALLRCQAEGSLNAVLTFCLHILL